MPSNVSSEIVVCSVSTTSRSGPSRPSISTRAADGRFTERATTVPPAASFCLAGLFIIALLLHLGRIAGASTPAASHHHSSVREATPLLRRKWLARYCGRQYLANHLG
jgi:hypothetical protein